MNQPSSHFRYSDNCFEKRFPNKNSHAAMHAALLIMAKDFKKSGCPSKHESISKQVYPCEGSRICHPQDKSPGHKDYLGLTDFNKQKTEDNS